MEAAARPRAVSNAMALDTVVAIPRRPLAWREFFLQCWFIARVSVVPALLLAMPFTVLAAFTLNVLLVDFGAADAAGTGAGVANGATGPARDGTGRRRSRRHGYLRRPGRTHHSRGA